MNRSEEVAGYALIHGIDQAAEKFNIERRSVRRYIRMAKEKPKKVNALLADIETAPMEVYVWGLYKQRIHHDNIIRD